jgi:hypothetical protein
MECCETWRQPGRKKVYLFNKSGIEILPLRSHVDVGPHYFLLRLNLIFR